MRAYKIESPAVYSHKRLDPGKSVMANGWRDIRARQLLVPCTVQPRSAVFRLALYVRTYANSGSGPRLTRIHLRVCFSSLKVLDGVKLLFKKKGADIDAKICCNGFTNREGKKEVEDSYAIMHGIPILLSGDIAGGGLTFIEVEYRRTKKERKKKKNRKT